MGQGINGGSPAEVERWRKTDAPLRVFGSAAETAPAQPSSNSGPTAPSRPLVLGAVYQVTNRRGLRHERQPSRGLRSAYGVTPKAGLSNFTPLRTA